MAFRCANKAQQPRCQSSKMPFHRITHRKIEAKTWSKKSYPLVCFLRDTATPHVVVGSCIGLGDDEDFVMFLRCRVGGAASVHRHHRRGAQKHSHSFLLFVNESFIRPRK